MKRIFIIGVMSLFISCNSDKTKDATTPSEASTASSTESLVYPYPVNYTDFKADDQKNTVAALNLWKYWDDGDMDNQKNLWADSAEVHTWDGFYIKGSRDSIYSSGKSYRNNYSSVTSSVSGVMSFSCSNKTTGKKENWAAVWGKRVMVDKNGKADSVLLHEAWRFNENGLADNLHQFIQKLTAQ